MFRLWRFSRIKLFIEWAQTAATLQSTLDSRQYTMKNSNNIDRSQLYGKYTHIFSVFICTFETNSIWHAYQLEMKVPCLNIQTTNYKVSFMCDCLQVIFIVGFLIQKCVRSNCAHCCSFIVQSTMVKFKYEKKNTNS